MKQSTTITFLAVGAAILIGLTKKKPTETLVEPEPEPLPPEDSSEVVDCSKPCGLPQLQDGQYAYDDYLMDVAVLVEEYAKSGELPTVFFREGVEVSFWDTRTTKGPILYQDFVTLAALFLYRKTVSVDCCQVVREGWKEGLEWLADDIDNIIDAYPESVEWLKQQAIDRGDIDAIT